MIGSAKRLLGAGALAAVLLLSSAQAATAQGGGRRAADPPAIAYRKAMMAANQQHIAAMRALLSGEISHPADIQMHADALADIGGCSPVSFRRGRPVRRRALGRRSGPWRRILQPG